VTVFNASAAAAEKYFRGAFRTNQFTDNTLQVPTARTYLRPQLWVSSTAVIISVESDGMSPRVEALLKARPNTWIALSEDQTRTVGEGDTFEEAVAAAEANGVDDPVLIMIPSDWAARAL